jgi:alpha-tubulin suppressor-like RCC1 family protein
MGGLAIRTGPPSGSPTPLRVPVEGARRIATQEHGTCAIVTDGAVTCWGRDAFDHVREPTIVEGVSGAVAVAAGARVACALGVDGVVSCWGRGNMGQLGDGTRESRAEARPVAELVDTVEIGAGDERACARLATGTVWCWGAGVLGDYYGRSSAPTPYRAHGLEGAIALGVGPDGACATIADGSTWCWGGSTRLPTRIE